MCVKLARGAWNWKFAECRRIPRKKNFRPIVFGVIQGRRGLHDVQEIPIWIQTSCLRRFHDAKDHSACLGTAGSVRKQPVFPAYYKRLNAAFGTVIAQFQPAILQIAQQIRPLFQQVFQSLPQGRLRRRLLDIVCRLNWILADSISCCSRYIGECITYFCVMICAMASAEAKLPIIASITIFLARNKHHHFFI